MVIDTSAVLAILQDEPERSAFNTVIAAAERAIPIHSAMVWFPSERSAH
jgi:uncharacterized protein with PIN domain